MANPPALGLVPQIYGLQIGKVVQLKDESEPDKDFRIKVRIPGFHSDEEGIWARIASLQAGDGHGLLFLPNVDDEVVIGYVGQDAREPIVLGSLYSESASPPFTNDDQNFVKGFVTNNDHRIVIDEEKNTVTVETSGGSKLVLDDGQSKVELSRGQSAIELTNTEIKLKANAITFDALTTIDIKAKGSANINSPTGGFVRLGQGVAPVAHVGNPVSLVAVTPGANVKVFV